MPEFEFNFYRNDAIKGGGLVQTQHGLDWPDGWAGEICLPSSLNGQPVTAVANSGFRGCPARIIVIPEGVTEICEHAFNSCLAESIELPETLRSIGPWAFYECKNLRSVKIPEGVTEIGFEAFYGCKHLERCTYPTSARVQKRAFEGCPFTGSVLEEKPVRWTLANQLEAGREYSRYDWD